MNEFQLKYGTNPNQKPARIFMADGSELPVTILNGKPGYINFLDAFNSYQLVKDLRAALGLLNSCQCKHGCPACVGVFGGEYDVKGAVRALAEEILGERRK